MTPLQQQFMAEASRSVNAIVEIEVSEYATVSSATGDQDFILLEFPTSLFEEEPASWMVEVAHEFIHAEQIADGRLDLENITFDGEPWGHLPYSEHPHEAEAYAQEETNAIEIAKRILQ